MAAQGKPSRWGSLLQQAVAGVEARLDTILAEGEAPGKPLKPSNPQLAPASAKPVAGPGRASSSTRVNDRLQERLAKAVASRSSTPTDPASNTLSSETSSARGSTDEGNAVPNEARVRASEETSSAEPRETLTGDATDHEDGLPRRPSLEKPAESEIKPTTTDHDSSPTIDGVERVRESSEGQGNDLATDTLPPASKVITGCAHCAVLEARIEDLRSALEESKSQHLEEIHGYVEQTDALQAKLQFLSREATESARKSALAASGGSIEQKLAEKDEKMIMLMEEGRTLAATEQKHRTIIKKLRSQVGEDEKVIADLRSNQGKALAELATLRSRATRVEDLERLHNDALRKGNRLQSELSSLRSELKDKDSALSKLQEEFENARSRADSAAAKANGEALESGHRRMKEFEDTIAALEVEKSLITERAKASAAELNEKVAKAVERTRIAELEMKGELQIMESKLEAMRILAEEASSGAIGDSQAKLLRQMETLQTQYAIASENWQGIESSLIARVGSLEKERDEALRRESDMRKKAREAAARCKRQEEELQEVRISFPSHQQDLETYQSRLESLTKRAEDADMALAQAKSDFERQQLSWKMERTDHERRHWLEDIAGTSSRNQSRPDSPLLSVPNRTFSADLLVLQGPPGKGRKVSTPTSITDGYAGGPSSSARRLSGQPPARPSVFPSSPGLPSTASPTSFDLFSDSLPTPSSQISEKEDMFDNVETSSSSRQGMQDMMSVSTVAAGPSVQLVERMSAAIRRLEAEKVTSREELARISSQRDEARAEILVLMKEMESGKVASKRVSELETVVADMNSRYQTTLELLGEKSELVEELRADVDDVKAMYRDLVERTVKG